MRDFPRRAWVYTGVVVLCAVSLGRVLAAKDFHLGQALAFGVLFLLAELAPIPTANGSYSVSYVIVVAALVSVGPAEASVAAAFGALDLGALKRPDWLGRAVFNGGQLSLATALSGIGYIRLGGRVGAITAADFPAAFVPVFAAASIYFLANTGLVSFMVSLVRRVAWKDIWHLNYLAMVPSTLAFGLLGVLLASLYDGMGLPAVLFVLVPLFVARSAARAASTMDEAYEVTLRGLVTAIEAKDAYTRGHAERVSRLAAMAAREYGLPTRKVRALRIAALMHDVGKLVVSTAILTKPGKLTDEEYEHMKSHPLHGCDVIEEIDFLRRGDAAFAVRHHHERMDGRGYPDGLVGDEVPLTARIVMVADAFDSMTSTRTYRFAKPTQDAIRELRRCSATQFDPGAILALERALRRHGWEASPDLSTAPMANVDVASESKVV